MNAYRSLRAGNTGREIVASGAWIKVGPKHYRHVSGVEVRYDSNHWGWRVDDGPQLWTALWVAVHYAERQAAEKGGR